MQDLERLEARVRIAAANKRIDELERKVGELEDTPEKLELDLLTNRVTALEVKAGGPLLASETPPLKEDFSLLPPTGTSPKQRKSLRQPAKRVSPLNLPDLENRSRLATSAEANAFSMKK